jgi:hypothetical protein
MADVDDSSPKGSVIFDSLYRSSTTNTFFRRMAFRSIQQKSLSYDSYSSPKHVYTNHMFFQVSNAIDIVLDTSKQQRHASRKKNCSWREAIYFITANQNRPLGLVFERNIMGKGNSTQANETNCSVLFLKEGRDSKKSRQISPTLHFVPINICIYLSAFIISPSTRQSNRQ